MGRDRKCLVHARVRAPIPVEPAHLRVLEPVHVRRQRADAEHVLHLVGVRIVVDARGDLDVTDAETRKHPLGVVEAVGGLKR